MRHSLAEAGTAGEVSAAAALEAKRITGRNIEFDLAGSDPQLAREHSEGVLRGLEEFPNTPLKRVQQGGDAEGERRAYASTSHDGGVITFMHSAQKDGPQAYRDRLQREEHSGAKAAGTGTPMGVATHEFGHAVSSGYQLDGPMGRHIEEYAFRHRPKRALDGSVVEKQLGEYAASSPTEAIAEAYSQARLQGPLASGIAIDTHAALTRMVKAREAGQDVE